MIVNTKGSKKKQSKNNQKELIHIKAQAIGAKKWKEIVQS